MKIYTCHALICLSLLTPVLPALGQGGFTDKAEAKNKLIGGVKEGKWIEYYKTPYETTTDTAAGVFYSLTDYKGGIPLGIIRKYYKSDKLLSSAPYFNGKKNGLEKGYFESGKPEWEAQYTNGKQNGIQKVYYEFGQLRWEALFTDGEINGVQKEYDENGNIKKETKYSNGITEEARKHFVKGTLLFKEAKTTADFTTAGSEFKQATDLAPEWPDARYNLALAKESAGDYASSLNDLKLYLQFKLADTEARSVQDKIYALELKIEMATKKQAEERSITAAAEYKKQQTRQVLDKLKAIVGDAEYEWYVASIGDYAKGGRSGLNMGEFEKEGKNWWSWGHYSSKYVFKDDKVFVCKYVMGPINGKDEFTDLNPDKADLIGTPNGPTVDDIVWESIDYYDQSGKAHNKKQVWVHIDEGNGDFCFSGDRPLTNPNRDAVYGYWWYSRK